MDLLRVVIGEIGAIRRRLRRRYCIYFRPDYVKKQMQERKGVCGQHGCCDLLIIHRIYNEYCKKCLSRKDDRTVCRHWGNLPKECQIYPLDEKDKIPETKAYCNFYW